MFNRFSSSASQPAGSTSFFGAPAPTAQPTQSTSPFSPFGGPPGSAQVSVAPSGVPSTPYSLTNELENGFTIKLLSISAMPAYRHLSQEEIRVDDYAKGRKGPSSFPGIKSGAFSQPFSSAPTTASNVNPSFTTGFGSTGSAGFGGFGSTSTTPAPQQQPTTTGFGSFGSTNTTIPTATTNTFGSSPFGSSGSNLFGSSTSGFGSSSGFGSTSTTAPSSGFGTFGTSSLTPTATTSNTPFGSTGLFGQPSQPQPQSTQPQQSAGFGGFGSTTQPAPSTGLFGSKPSTGLFGSAPSASTTTTTGTGTTSLFGQTQPQQQSTGFSGFGSTQPQSQSSGFGGLFGSQPSATSANSASPSSFGFNSAPSSTPTVTSSFGQPPSSGLFQSSSSSFRPSAPTSNPFGFNTTATANPTTSSIIPPSATTPLAPAPSSSGMGIGSGSSFFAPQSSQSSGNGGIGNGASFFNKSLTTLQPNGSGFVFPTSTNTNTSTSTNTLNSATTGTGISTGSGTNSFMSNFPNVAPPQLSVNSGSLSLAPPLPSIYSSRQVTTESHASTNAFQPSKSPVKFTPRTSFRIKPRESYNLTTPIPLNFGVNGTSYTENTVLIPRKLVNTSSSNMKKLVIPEFTAEEEPNTFKPPQSQQIQATPQTSTTTTTMQNSNILTDSMSYGQQYTFPPLKILKSTPQASLREVKNFVIGQKGVGEIRFLVPVDLSEIDPDTLFGHYIEFCEGEAVLYPDPNILKPDPGFGLNLPAQVRLDRVWAHSKGSRDPIVDPQNEKVILFTQKLKEAEGTNFVSYDPITGTWTFTVDHF